MQSESSPKITVVMGCYNQKLVLERVLPAYEVQTASKTDFEVIVIDSTSSDGTGEWFNSCSFSFQFQGIVQPNRGKAAARNAGVQLAKGRFIIITDSDMIPDPGFIQAHLEAHLTTSRPSCFEGLAWNLPSLDWPPSPDTLKPQVGTHPQNGAKLGWYYFLTGNLSFPKALFIQFEGFDEKFTGYGWEDLELGYRFSRSGIPLYYLRSAINYHYHVVRPEDELPRCKDKGISAQYMLSKHPELKLFLGLNPLSTFVFPRISQSGALFRWIKTQCFGSKNALKHRFGLWFLKEYYYLQGLMGTK